MHNQILNTNMGLGFQRGRKYDTDMDRLGRMKTAQFELRKTRELNLQGELKKLKKTMNMYSVKRFSWYQRNYGLGNVAEGVGNGLMDAAGSTLKAGGKMLDNGLAKTAAAGIGLGAMGSGATAGAAIGSAVGGPIGGAIGGLVGAAATPFAAAKATGIAGQTLKSIGNDIHT